MRKLIAGNWKMNGLLAEGTALAGDLAARSGGGLPNCDLLICPPAQLLQPVRAAIEGSAVALGAQDCHAEEAGAHTGDISAVMLADIGCSHVIVGHSERRQNHGEGDQAVRAKAVAALAAGLIPVICVGETADQRAGGEALRVIESQIKGSVPNQGGQGTVVVAYEPVWAIGTGNTAGPEDVAQAHAHIRQLLGSLLGAAAAETTRILYGGSVKPGNAAELMAVENVDGALVGGASLVAADFWAIAEACR